MTGGHGSQLPHCPSVPDWKVSHYTRLRTTISEGRTRTEYVGRVYKREIGDEERDQLSTTDCLPEQVPWYRCLEGQALMRPQLA